MVDRCLLEQSCACPPLEVLKSVVFGVMRWPMASRPVRLCDDRREVLTHEVLS